MSELTKEYFDKAFENLSNRMEERFESLIGTINKSFEGVEDRFAEVNGRLDSQTTDIALIQKDVREIKDTLGTNVMPRLSNLEAHVESE